VKFRAVLCLLALSVAAPVKADPVTVATTPLESFESYGGAETFGALSWRGGLVLTSADSKFGGLSGLVIDGDCTRLMAVSDAGRWFRATLHYDDGRLAGISDGEIAPILDTKGKPPRDKFAGDAEAIFGLGQDRFMVGFESRPRIGIYDLGKNGLAARFRKIASPKAIAAGPSNGELEAIGYFASGPWRSHYLAISERNTDAEGNIRGWVWTVAETVAFLIRRHESYEVTDAAILPGGDVVTVERSFSRTSLPGMAIRRFPAADITAGRTIEPQLVFAGRYPFYEIDNMEGIAICRRDGETRLTLVSDDNFSRRLQRTLLLQFALSE